VITIITMITKPAHGGVNSSQLLQSLPAASDAVPGETTSDDLLPPLNCTSLFIYDDRHRTDTSYYDSATSTAQLVYAQHAAQIHHASEHQCEGDEDAGVKLQLLAASKSVEYPWMRTEKKTAAPDVMCSPMSTTSVSDRRLTQCLAAADPLTQTPGLTIILTDFTVYLNIAQP